MSESTPLSQTTLFPGLRQFYTASGVDAWAETVPLHATSNPELANCYATVIVRFVQDAIASGRADPGEPFYVAELGAGSGKFGFHLVKRMRELRMALGLTQVRIVHVMSDVVDANIDFWRHHPRLQPFMDRGELVLARFDALTDDEFAVLPTGADATTTDAPAPRLATFANPLVVIANYVFDSLPQDLFRVTDGQVDQMLATPSDGDVSGATRLTWTPRPVVLPHYGEPEVDAILEESVSAASPGVHALMFPVTALRVLRRLADAASGRLCLLAADLGLGPGLPTEPDLQVSKAATFFYLPVDISVVRRLFERLGPGLHRHRPAAYLDVSLSVAGFEPDELRETRYAFSTSVEAFGPRGRAALTSLLDQSRAALGPEEWLALSSLLRYDSLILWSSTELISGWVQSVALHPHLRTEILGALRLFGAEIYWTPGGPDSYFDLATMLQELGEFKAAVASYVRSIETVGPSTAAYINLAQALRTLGRLPEALEALRDALVLDPTDIVARGWLGRIELEQSGDLTPPPDPSA